MTKIISCTCQSEYQDKRYGAGKRVANTTDNGDARCTVCGSTKSAPAKPKESK